MDRNGISVLSDSGKEIDPRVISVEYKGDQFVGRKCQNQSVIQCKSDEQIVSDLTQVRNQRSKHFQIGNIQVSIPIGYLNELSGEIAHFNMSINFTSYPSASQVTLQHHKVYKPESLYTYLPQGMQSLIYHILDADITDPTLQSYVKLLSYYSLQPSSDDYLFSLSLNIHPLQTLTILSIREASPLALLTDIASFSLFLSFLAWIVCGSYNQFNMERSLIAKLYKCEKNEQ